ncbi:MAG: SAM-dependent methyltransferase [bacterium]
MKKKKLVALFPAVAVLFLALIISCNKKEPDQPAPERSDLPKHGFYLVGMGPGDPDLATLQAVNTVKKADLVIGVSSHLERFSHLVEGKQKMSFPPPAFVWFGYGHSEADFKGKELQRFRKAKKSRRKVVKAIREAHRQGKKVVILDNGDPMIYGRWTWALTELKELDPEVIPGLSSFNASQAVIGKEVVWTGLSKTAILTANDFASGKDTIENLARHQVTMFVYTMGLSIPDLADKLEEYYPPDTPIAIICYAGYRDKEYVIKGTLANIRRKTSDQEIPFEHLVIVGENLDFQWKKN